MPKNGVVPLAATIDPNASDEELAKSIELQLMHSGDPTAGLENTQAFKSGDLREGGNDDMKDE